MSRYVKIGLVVGAIGAVNIAVRSIKKSFDFGVETGISLNRKAVDAALNEAEKKYNALAEAYNELEENYCDLLDEIDEMTEEDAE